MGTIMNFFKKNKLLLLMIFILVSCGGGGGGDSSSKAPTVSISSSTSEVLVGQNASITWSSDQSSCSASGAWSGSKAGQGTESVTITSAGSNNFSINCGGGASSVSILGYRNSEGIVADGYLSDATVFFDTNENKSLDSDETSIVTTNDGKFSMRHANGTLISLGGKDVDTQTVLDQLIMATPNDGYIDGPVITPLTTLALIMDSPENLNVALGLDTSIDILSTDPVANLTNGGIYNILYERGNQITILALALKNLHDSTNTATDSTVDFFQSIASELEQSYNASQGKVDIESRTFIANVIAEMEANKSATISAEAKANVADALSSVLPLIQVKNNSSITTALVNFGLNTLQSDISAISLGENANLVQYADDKIKDYIGTTESVSASDLLPTIQSFDDVAQTEEDTAVTIAVLNNDSLLEGDVIIKIASLPGKGTVSVSGNLIIYTPSKDENGEDSFSYTVSIGSNSSTASVVISISPVNDAPTINTQTTIKGVSGSTSVSGLSITDVDGDELTISLSGDDADVFQIIDGVLTFKSAPDYFVKNTYSITIVATDGILETSLDITVRVFRLQTTGFEVPEAIKVIETL
jgi:hypothetical protein